MRHALRHALQEKDREIERLVLRNRWAEALLHEIEARSDPAGEARAHILTRDENAMLKAKLAETGAEIERLKAELDELRRCFALEQQAASAARDATARMVEALRSTWPHIELPVSVSRAAYFGKKRHDPGAPTCLRCGLEQILAAGGWRRDAGE